MGDVHLPAPGRLRSLGSEIDYLDAEALLAVLRAARGVRERHGQRVRAVREWVWEAWELPRLPRPLLTTKYPTTYPWSPEAQAVYRAAERRPNGGLRRPAGGWGLVLEHLTPRALLVRELLDRADHLTPDDLVSHLNRQLMAAVITRAEDRQLGAAGVAQSMPEDANGPWSRYLAAGFDLPTFAPVG